MTSEVAIANRALQLLGADSIISLSEDNNRARTLRIAYEPVRDAEQHRRRWRFCIKRAQLAALSAAPDFGYSYQYQLPNDYLRLIEGGDIASAVDLSDYRSQSSAAYSVEGDRVLTNYGAPLSIRYLARITDTSKFNASFVEALSARLAYECCERITQSNEKRNLAERQYKDALKEARQANALEVASESIADDAWIIARMQ